MKTLLIMRHAKSSWKDTDVEDHERPLNKRGKKEAPKMGKQLRDKGLMRDLIVGSTARRVRQTVDRLMEASGYRGPVRLTPRLYLAEPEAYVQVIQSLDNSYGCPLLIGHNPGLEDLLSLLTGKEAALPTGALAQVELPIEGWRDLKPDGEAKTVNLWSPQDL